MEIQRKLLSTINISVYYRIYMTRKRLSPTSTSKHPWGDSEISCLEKSFSKNILSIARKKNPMLLLNQESLLLLSSQFFPWPVRVSVLTQHPSRLPFSHLFSPSILSCLLRGSDHIQSHTNAAYISQSSCSWQRNSHHNVSRRSEVFDSTSLRRSGRELRRKQRRGTLKLTG